MADGSCLLGLVLTLASAPLVLDSLFRALYLAYSLVGRVWSSLPTRRLPTPSHLFLRPVACRLPPAACRPFRPRLAVVIPAHDEAGVIGATVAAVCASDYPPPRTAVHVIADNCTDATADTARAAGACIWERREAEPRGKAAALAWFLKTAANALADVDAVVILDADTRLAPNALTELARALDWAPVAQGCVQPRYADGATVASLAAYSEILSQAVDDVARAGLGWSAPLRGTGMALPPRLLAELTPRLRTSIEDSELSLLLAERGIPIAFAPRAIIGDPKPADAALAARQRARWLQGRFALYRAYGPTLLRLLVSGRPGDAALALTLGLRPKTFFLALKAGLGVGLSATARLGGQRRALSSLRLSGRLLLVASGVDLAYYVLGLLAVEQPGVYARVLLRAPLYGVMWLRGLKTALTSREAWLSVRRTARDGRPPTADGGQDTSGGGQPSRVRQQGEA